ncbi:MAG: CcoQ/FixQ family Cbb3-type cytochrome c oxidase assembly chaperone [Ferruginibacter sp.]|nr:CcoQ/FixQ family Cbb3-type cytochrome c oxidase assembly chaperone [Ferruginibacter sp.]
MYKFIKQYTEKMDHATIYPMISLLIFFLFFVVLLVLVNKMDKQKIADLSSIPLDTDDTITSTK